MKLSLKDPVVVYIISLLFIAAALYLSQRPVTENSESSYAIFSTIFGVVNKGPLAAVLDAHLKWTMLYGFWYYAICQKREGTRNLSLAFFGAVYLGLWFADKYLDDETPAWFVRKEYFAAAILTSFFFFVDRSLSKKEIGQEAARLRFSANYISLPTLFTLGLSFLIYLDVEAYQQELGRQGAVAFAAGTATAILFLSNLVFALMVAKWYSPSLALSLTGGAPQTDRAE